MYLDNIDLLELLEIFAFLLIFSVLWGWEGDFFVVSLCTQEFL